MTWLVAWADSHGNHSEDYADDKARALARQAELRGANCHAIAYEIEDTQ